MTRPFTRGADGSVVVGLDSDERGYLAFLCDQVASLLRPAPEVPDAALRAADLSDTEAELFAQLAGLGSDATVEPPSDPVVARLLPDAFRDDPRASAEYRRLGEAELRRSKLRHLEVAAAALRRPGRRVDLDNDETQSLLKALNDVRLSLGETLGLRSDEDAEAMAAALEVAEAAGAKGRSRLGIDDAWVAQATVYEVLGVWQSMLLDCLTD